MEQGKLGEKVILVRLETSPEDIEAMKYFELKYDDENYSKAYKQYRKEWVEEHIVIIVIVILALFLIPLAIGKIRRLKYEIDTADIFRV